MTEVAEVALEAGVVAPKRRSRAEGLRESQKAALGFHQPPEISVMPLRRFGVPGLREFFEQAATA